MRNGTLRLYIFSIILSKRNFSHIRSLYFNDFNDDGVRKCMVPLLCYCDDRAVQGLLENSAGGTDQISAK